MFTREELQDIGQRAHLATFQPLKKYMYDEYMKLFEACNKLDAFIARDGEINEE